MTFSENFSTGHPEGRSQPLLTCDSVDTVLIDRKTLKLLTLSRRELLQKTASVALPFFASRLQPEKYSQLQFRIGDRIVSSWLDDEGKALSEFGEVVGICLHPKMQQWQYLINWVGENRSGHRYSYFDGSLTDADDLRLVSHE
jgi:hypothetical protein